MSNGAKPNTSDLQLSFNFPNVKALIDEYSNFSELVIVSRDGNRFIAIWNKLTGQASIFNLEDKLVETLVAPGNELFKKEYLVDKGYTLIG